MARWQRLPGWIGVGLVLVPLLFAGPACSRRASDDSASGRGGESSQQTLVERGRQVFQTHCTTCHSVDPRQPGPVGPAIAGSPLELLRYKVLHNAYPPGYKPQRTTHAMIPFPQLEKELPAIAAYLDSLKQ